MAVVLANPQVTVNNVAFAIKPNSLVFTEGFGEQIVRAASAGGSLAVQVLADNIEDNFSEVKFALDPTFEPDRGEESERLSTIQVIDDNVDIYRELQQCNRHGLLVPVDQPHMWHAAVFSTGCELTATGVHYRKLAEMKRI